MTCLAGISAHLDGFLRAAATAEVNLVVDGCPIACGRKTFHRLSLPCISLLLTDFGVEKSRTAITENLIADMTALVAKQLEPVVELTQP